MGDKLTRPITVDGSYYPASVLDQAWHALHETFTAVDLENALRDIVNSEDRVNCYRAADRLLQQKRKAGLSKFVRPHWEKVPA